MTKILLVEDDKSFGYVLSEYMQLKGYEVTWKETAIAAMEALANESFHMAVLDINLKNASGYDVAIEIRKENYSIPFIFLTARDLKIDQLKGYQYGAEEFITKPIDEEILIAKIDAILARNKTVTVKSEKLAFKDVVLDSNKRELIVLAEIFQLTEKESLLMKSFIENAEILVDRNTILKEIWENQDEFSRNSMDVYISRLRKYLAASDVVIRNVHGKGFILE